MSYQPCCEANSRNGPRLRFIFSLKHQFTVNPWHYPWSVDTFMSESILLIVILVFRQVPDGHSSSSASSRTPRNRASTSNQEEVHIGKYRLIKTIGKGNFAKVKTSETCANGKRGKQTLSFSIYSDEFVRRFSLIRWSVPACVFARAEGWIVII